jgi:hypothetical protein
MGIKPSKVEVFGRILSFHDDYLTLELGSASPPGIVKDVLIQRIPYENIISYELKEE